MPLHLALLKLSSMWDYVFDKDNLGLSLYVDNDVKFFSPRGLNIKFHEIQQALLALTTADEVSKIMHEIRSARNKAIGVPGLGNLWLKEVLVKSPITGEITGLIGLIIRLNDVERWTREQIADWLDTLPNQPVLRLMEDL